MTKPKQSSAGRCENRPVVVALHEFSDMAWWRQLFGIRRYCEARGWRVASIRTNAVDDAVRDYIARENPIGIISSLTDGVPGDIASSWRVVYFDCPAAAVKNGAPYVRHDAEYTAHLVANELFRLNCRAYTFAEYIGGLRDAVPSWSRGRERFFRREVSKRNGVWKEPFSPGSDDRHASRMAALRKWLAALPKPCGIFAANDFVAVRVLKAGKLEGISIPDEVAIVGVDDNRRLCLANHPTLTSVAPDWEGGGWVAAAVLGDLVDGLKIADKRMTFHPLGILRRETTTRTSAREDSRILQAVALIRAKACLGINVEQVASAMHTSRRFAEKFFREVTGSSILEEIRRVRFEKAKLLLSYSMDSLLRIASKCGYSSVPTFCREFKKLTGFTPDSWRAQKMSLAPKR